MNFIINLYIMIGRNKKIFQGNEKPQYNIFQSPYFNYNNNINSDDTPASSRTQKIKFDKLLPKQGRESPFMQGSRGSSGKAKTQFNYSRSGNSNYTMSIKQRIQKACTTLNTADLQKQNMLLTRQLEKLQKQILRKDQQLIQMKTNSMPNKQIKAEIIELYRALSFFEGKIKQMESQIYKFRQMILKSPGEGVNAENLNVMFQDLRKSNEQLSAQYQQANFINQILQDKEKRLTKKFYELQRELWQYKRRQKSPLYQYYLNNGIPVKVQPSIKMNKIFHNIMNKDAPTQMELKQRQAIIRQLQDKIQQFQQNMIMVDQELSKMQSQVSKTKIQNQLLKSDLDDKNKQITELFKNYMGAKKTVKLYESQMLIRSQKSIQKTQHNQGSNWTPNFKYLPKYSSSNLI